MLSNFSDLLNCMERRLGILLKLSKEGMKKVIIFLVVFSFLLAPVVTGAQTNVLLQTQNRQQLINQLLALIVQLKQQLAILQGQVPRPIISTPSPIYSTPPPISQNPREKKYAVLLINFDSNPVEPVTGEEVNKFYFDQSNPKSLSSYYKEVSYGAMNLVGDIYGYYTLAYSQISPYNSGCGYSVDDVSNYIRAINDVNFAKYDGVILTIVPKAGCSAPLPNGLRRTINTTSGNKEIGVVYNFIDVSHSWDKLNEWAMPHEFGHSLGLRHSSYVDCQSRTITENIFRDCKILNLRVSVGCPADNPMCSGCAADDQACIARYAKGDLFDVMGSNEGGLSVYQREKVGFLLDRQMNVVKSSGIYTIEPRETNTLGVKAIKIPLREHSSDGNDKDFYYYIEYVRPIGSDKILSSRGELNGAFVHLVNPNGLLSLIPGYQDYDDQAILDMSPHSNTDMNIYENIKDVVLKTGQTFKDEKLRISIKTIDVKDDKLVVEINFY